MYIYIYVHAYVCRYVYIYIYISNYLVLISYLYDICFYHMTHASVNKIVQ